MKLRNIFISNAMIALLTTATTTRANEICEVALTFDPSELNFVRHRAWTRSHDRFLDLISARLVEVNNENEIVPNLAESWSVNEAERSVVFKLNNACGWSDGTPIVAKDIVEGFRELYRYDQPVFSGWDAIRGAREIFSDNEPVSSLGIEALSDDEVKIYFAGNVEVGLLGLTGLAYTGIPTHDLQTESYSYNSPKRLSSGAYMLTESTAEYMRFERNPYYCDASRYGADEVKLLLTADDKKIVRKFVTGQTNFLEHLPVLDTEAFFKNWPNENKPKIYYMKPMRQMNFIMHPLRAPLDDIEVRKRLLKVIDRNYFTYNSKDGFRYEVADSIFHQVAGVQNVGYPMIDKDAETVREELRELMKAKGFSADNPAKITITTFQIPRFERFAYLVASQLRSVYIDLQLLESKSASQTTENFATKRADIFLSSWTLDFPHLINSAQGYTTYYGYLMYPNGEWSYYGKEDDYLTDLERVSQAVADAKTSQEQTATLRKFEERLNRSHLVLPFLREQPPIMTSQNIILNGEFDIKYAFRALECE